MADVKKILVVDDHFEMLEFLRTMLEHSNEDYEVLAVPSAEEGLLELRRQPFDLLITDVRLPGMSGFDLVRRARRIRSGMPVIIITAYSSEEGQKEAAELSVLRYFRKPLDTEDMLTAVHEALYGPGAEQQVPLAENNVSPRVHKRLETLRTDTGASQLILARTAGELLLRIGGGRSLDFDDLTQILARNLEDSFLLAERLGSNLPFTIQYHTGDGVEMYVANVGRDHFLAMFFDVEARRGRIGTIWVFAQRAIKDLLRMLPHTAVAEPPALAPEPEDKPVVAETAVPLQQPTPPSPAAEITPEPEPEEEWLEVDPDELGEMLENVELDEEDVDLDEFWDDALAETGLEGTIGGFSLEEAQRQGLISPELDFDETAD